MGSERASGERTPTKAMEWTAGKAALSVALFILAALLEVGGGMVFFRMIL